MLMNSNEYLNIVESIKQDKVLHALKRSRSA